MTVPLVLSAPRACQKTEPRGALRTNSDPLQEASALRVITAKPVLNHLHLAQLASSAAPLQEWIRPLARIAPVGATVTSSASRRLSLQTGTRTATLGTTAQLAIRSLLSQTSALPETTVLPALQPKSHAQQELMSQERVLTRAKTARPATIALARVTQLPLFAQKASVQLGAQQLLSALMELTVTQTQSR